jgi:hypothetical protein
MSSMTLIVLYALLSLLGILYALYRRAMHTSIAKIPGPEPESFLLGMSMSFYRPLLAQHGTHR